jgi:pilus assembly protein CpaC
MRMGSKPIGWPLAVAMAAASIGTASAPVTAQSVISAPVLELSISRGRLVTLPRPISDVFVADEKVADVQVRSPTQIYIFAKAAGETTVSATTKSGAVVYTATVRVGQNYDSVQHMLDLAMPDSHIVATPMNGLILLTGIVANPQDADDAEKLVQAFVGDTTKVLSRLKTAVPLQVNLQVRIAEASRSFVKNIGNNILTRDTTGGFQFGLSSGSRVPGTIGNYDTSGLPVLDASSKFGFPAGTLSLPFDPKTGQFVYPNSGSAYNITKGVQNATIGAAGKLFGLDILSALDLGETDGQVTTLANPNLTALSGETATFLAGGEIPIPVSQGLGAVSVEYKQYGVSLSYTPTVLSDGRISLRVRPEVSQLSAQGAVTIAGISIPALTTRRTETTVELGSGQSFMIAGLLENNHTNSIDKTPGLGDVPVLGAMFRSNAWQRNETELVIVITPYLVKPVNGTDIALPTDGYKAPTDLDRVLLGQLGGGTTGGERPKPSVAVPVAGAEPAFGAAATVPPAPQPDKPAPVPQQQAALPAIPAKKTPDAAPGFSLN